MPGRKTDPSLIFENVAENSVNFLVDCAVGIPYKFDFIRRHLREELARRSCRCHPDAAFNLLAYSSNSCVAFADSSVSLNQQNLKNASEWATDRLSPSTDGVTKLCPAIERALSDSSCQSLVLLTDQSPAESLDEVKHAGMLSKGQRTQFPPVHCIYMYYLDPEPSAVRFFQLLALRTGGSLILVELGRYGELLDCRTEIEPVMKPEKRSNHIPFPFADENDRHVSWQHKSAPFKPMENILSCNDNLARKSAIWSYENEKLSRQPTNECLEYASKVSIQDEVDSEGFTLRKGDWVLARRSGTGEFYLGRTLTLPLLASDCPTSEDDRVCVELVEFPHTVAKTLWVPVSDLVPLKTTLNKLPLHRDANVLVRVFDQGLPAASRFVPGKVLEGTYTPGQYTDPCAKSLRVQRADTGQTCDVVPVAQMVRIPDGLYNHLVATWYPSQALPSDTPSYGANSWRSTSAMKGEDGVKAKLDHYFSPCSPRDHWLLDQSLRRHEKRRGLEEEQEVVALPRRQCVPKDIVSPRRWYSEDIEGDESLFTAFSPLRQRLKQQRSMSHHRRGARRLRGISPEDNELSPERWYRNRFQGRLEDSVKDYFDVNDDWLRRSRKGEEDIETFLKRKRRERQGRRGRLEENEEDGWYWDWTYDIITGKNKYRRSPKWMRDPGGKSPDCIPPWQQWSRHGQEPPPHKQKPSRVKSSIQRYGDRSTAFRGMLEMGQTPDCRSSHFRPVKTAGGIFDRQEPTVRELLWQKEPVIKHRVERKEEDEGGESGDKEMGQSGSDWWPRRSHMIYEKPRF